MTRELASKLLEFNEIRLERAARLFVIRASSNDMAIRMNGTRSAIVSTYMILPHSIDANDISLILDGTSWEKSIPCQSTLLGPVGYADEYIIGIGIGKTRPNREAQIVADKQKKTYATPRDNHTIPTCLIAKLFTSDAEKMMLIGVMDLTLGGNKETTVTVERGRSHSGRFIESDGKRTTKSSIIPNRQFEQTVLDNRGSLKLMKSRCSDKARRTHLGQNQKIRIGILLEDRFYFCKISFR